MAGPTETDKAVILAELAAARVRLSETGGGLRRQLDVPTRAKESFREHRPAWLGGAALIGLVLSKIPARKKTVLIERATGKAIGAIGAAGKLGVVWSVAKFAFNFARPLISEFAGKHAGDFARRFGKTGKQPAENDRP